MGSRRRKQLHSAPLCWRHALDFYNALLLVQSDDMESLCAGLCRWQKVFVSDVVPHTDAHVHVSTHEVNVAPHRRWAGAHLASKCKSGRVQPAGHYARRSHKAQRQRVGF